ncbi:hypothetical protein [Methanobrevibacter sp. DSM 116169]|uniref:hypothetical protein n=1 Tax=Methanobrevibacter sp. DSM 116169 TaxID=3242727 RepID=UPI0038FD0191
MTKKDKKDLNPDDINNMIDDLSHDTYKNISKAEHSIDDEVEKLEKDSDRFIDMELDDIDLKEKVLSKSFKLNESSKDLKKKLDEI